MLLSVQRHTRREVCQGVTVHIRQVWDIAAEKPVFIGSSSKGEI